MKCKRVALLLIIIAIPLVFRNCHLWPPNVALFKAATVGDVRKVKIALGLRASVNARACTFDDACETPLHYAALNNHPKIAELLLDRGADVNARTRGEESTPLGYAALTGSTKVAEVLIARGADINARCALGYTALSLARREGHTEIVRMLSVAGAQE